MSAASSAFGRRLSLGVEEELFLVDPETWDLAPSVERILGPPGLKTELFAAVVETNTPPCATAAEALAELRRLRGVVREAGEREGVAVAAAGSHGSTASSRSRHSSKLPTPTWTCSPETSWRSAPSPISSSIFT